MIQTPLVCGLCSLLPDLYAYTCTENIAALICAHLDLPEDLVQAVGGHASLVVVQAHVIGRAGGVDEVASKNRTGNRTQTS